MVKIAFTLQKFPEHLEEFVVDYQSLNEDEQYTVREETAIAILLNERFPKIHDNGHRIKNLTVTDDKGKTYTTDDFDIPGSLKKADE